MSSSCREVLPDIREWFGGAPGCPEGSSGCPVVYGRPSRMTGSGREAPQMSGSGRESLPHVR